jgi:hypothetical protein
MSLIDNADNPNAFHMDLQLFAEGDPAPAPAADPTPVATPAVEPTPEPTAPSDPRQTQSLADFFESRKAGNEPAPEVAPEVQPITPVTTPKPIEPQQDVPDKFKNADGSVNTEAIIKSYTNMESMYSKQQNTVQQMTELQQTVIALQQQIAQQAQASAQPEQQLTPEEIEAQAEADNEKFWEAYNTNPKSAIADLVKEAVENSVKPMMDPILQERESQQQVAQWDQRIQEFTKDHDDFESVRPAMQEILQSDEAVKQFTQDHPDKGIALLYDLAIAKSKQAPATPEATPAPKTAEEMMNDPEFVAKFVSNPAVKDMVLKQHMQNLKNNPAPPVIGAQGGLPPSTQPVDMTNMKTAAEALKAKYAGISFQ